MKCGACMQMGRLVGSCVYCGGTGVIPETFCHCGAPTVNVTRTLCSVHVNELIAARMRAEEERIAAERAKWRFFIPDGDIGISFEDEGAWRAYEISGAQGNTEEEFFASITIMEVCQDGGELSCYAFDEAPSEVQRAIRAAVGLGVAA